MSQSTEEMVTIMTDTDEGVDVGNLYTSISKFNVHGLNLTDPDDARAVIKSWGEREDISQSAKSNVDDQLIIFIPFAENVRINTLLIKHAGGELAPKRLRIYVNRPDIVGFDEADDIRPHLDFALESGVALTPYPVRSAAFASVHSLSLFFSEAEGEECTELYYIGFRGVTRDHRREGTQKLEIPAANAPDAKVVDRLAERTANQQSTAR